MKKLEIKVAILFAVAIILKIASLPGAGIMTSISLGALACVYLLFGIAIFNNIPDASCFSLEAYKSISKQRIAFSILAGWGFSAICIGALFILMHWPGAEITMYVGLAVTLTTAIGAFIYRKKSDFFKTIMHRFGLGILLGLACLILG